MENAAPPPPPQGGGGGVQQEACQVSRFTQKKIPPFGGICLDYLSWRSGPLPPP